MKINDIPEQGRPAHVPLQLIRIMKLTAIIITFCLIQVSAATKAQITLNEKKAPLQKILESISTQSGYDFIYSTQDLKDLKIGTIKLNNVSIETALQAAFDGQPLLYEIADKTVMVKRKEEKSILDKVKDFLDLTDIHGHIVDENGQSLPGVNVRIKGTNQGTITDAKGNFSISKVGDNATIEISFIGYNKIELPTNSDLGYIKLAVATSQLDAVQVIAYDKTSQRLNTGNVSVVSAKTISEQPVNNPLLALEGQVAGLFITQASGASGSGVSVQLRGQNSIANGNDPLYVIDGVPYSSQLLPGQRGQLGNSGNSPNSQAGNPFNYINPSNIESISILKDAAATAIYGSRGANGVILITTKTGKAGATKVDASIQSGYGEVTRKADLLNTQQYLEMRREALKNDGITPSLENGDYDLLQWDTNRNTDWQKVLLGNTANYTDAEVSISGGSDNTQFLIGTGYNRETSVYPGSFSNRKGSLHFNLSNKSLNKKLTISLTGNYMVDNNQMPSEDLTGVATSLAPNAPPLYQSNGSLNWAVNASGSSTFHNPLAYEFTTYNNNTSNLVSNMVVGYEIIPGLTIKSNFGYTNLQSNEDILQPLVALTPERQASKGANGRVAITSSGNMNSWIIEPQVNYDKIIGKGKLNILIGSTAEQNNSQGQALLGKGYISDLSLQDFQSASTITQRGFTQSIYKYTAVFGRVNYNYDDEYLIDITTRRDGSSRFGSSNQFHDFGAVGVAWVFSKEAFLKNYLPFISFGKLRASYGTTGNDQIGDYNYLSLYSPTYYEATVYQGLRGLTPNGIANPYLQWELTKKIELGLETGFLNDRILFTTSYSQNRSSNQLLGAGLPGITGFGGITENFPATVQNTSLEFTLNTINVTSKQFRWTSSINLTIPRNKLFAYPGLATSQYAHIYKIGNPTTDRQVYHFEGVDPATGQYQFTSTTDKFNPQLGTDDNIYINTLPKFYGGFQNSISYNGFKLDFFFQFVKQIGRNNLFSSSYPAGAFAAGSGNQYTYVLSRWQNPSDVTTIQRYNSNFAIGNGYAAQSDAAYSDASYLRLKNVSLSYQFQESWVKSLHFSSLRVFARGQNLLTVTSYKGMDPENNGNGLLPPLRVLTIGLQVGL